IEQRNGPVFTRALSLDDALEKFHRRIERKHVGDIAAPHDRHVDGDQRCLRDRADKDPRIEWLPGLEYGLSAFPILSRRKKRPGGNTRIDDLSAVAIGKYKRRFFSVEIREGFGALAEPFDIALLYRLRQRKHFQAGGDAVDL